MRPDRESAYVPGTRSVFYRDFLLAADHAEDRMAALRAFWERDWQVDMADAAIARAESGLPPARNFQVYLDYRDVAAGYAPQP